MTDDKAASALADGVLTLPRAARFSGISTKVLTRLMDARTIGYVRHGRFRLIPKRELVEYLRSIYVPALSDAELLKPKGRAG